MEANTRHFCEGFKPGKQGNNFWSCNILTKCGSKVIDYGCFMVVLVDKDGV